MNSQQLSETEQSPNGTTRDDGGHNEPDGSDVPSMSRAREWSAFYESFDELVRDNIQRSNDLLRQATELPGVADRAVAHTRAEMESRIAAEKSQHVSKLASLQAEIRAGHQQLEALAQSMAEAQSHFERLSERLAAELTQADAESAQTPPIDTTESADQDAPSINGTASATVDEPLTAESSEETMEPSIASMMDEPVESPPSAEIEPPATAENEPEPAVSEASEAPETTPQSVMESEAEPAAEVASEADEAGLPAREVSVTEDAAAVAEDDADNVVPFTGTEEAEAPGAEAEAAPEEQLDGSHIVMLLVSGVRRLPLVIQLQRHLAGFDEVERVRLRDFVAGVVRFEVAAHRPIELADVHAWCAGAGMEITSMKGTDIEVRLTEAATA